MFSIRTPGFRTIPQRLLGGGRTRLSGQTTIEFLLLLALFLLPAAVLTLMIRRYHRDLFTVVSWFLSLPIP